MPCEILIKNIDNIDLLGVDAETSRSGTWKRGYLVVVKDLPHPGWGSKEGLPGFVIIRLTDSSAVQVNQYLNSYNRILLWTNDSHDAPNDTWIVSLSVDNLDLSKYAAVTKFQIETYLNKWRATVISFTASSVTFETKISEAINSIGFWDIKAGEASGLVLTEINYNQGQRIHTQEVDYLSYRPEIMNRNKIRYRLLSMIEERKGVITNIDIPNQVITFTLTAENVKAQFISELKERHSKVVWRRQYYFPSGVMNTIQTYMQNNNGAPYETDRATALSFLNNRKDE